jgi:hypothetical protein
MSRTYHKPHPHAPPASGASPGEVSGRARVLGSRLVADISRLLDTYPWLYYVCFGTLGGSWGAGFWLVTSVPGRLAMSGGGLLLILGGFIEIVLARALARARDNSPWWLRAWEEGYFSSMIDYGPGTFRFFGSAVAGAGCGGVSYGIIPNTTAAAAVAIVAALAIWVWTWFAFSAMDD